jgi:HicB family
MELSEYSTGLRAELASLTRFAGEDVTRVAEMLAESLDSAVRLTLLEVLSAAAAEITSRLDGVAIDVRLSSGEPDFVVTVAPSEAPAEETGPGAVGDEAGTSRVTLRLSEALKGRIEAEAAAAGLSVNSWLVHAAIRALEDPGSAGRGSSRIVVGKRITGYHRS